MPTRTELRTAERVTGDTFLYDSREERPRPRKLLKPRRFTPRDKWRVQHTADGRWEAGPAAAHVFIDRSCHIRAVAFPTWRQAFEFAFFKSQEES